MNIMGFLFGKKKKYSSPVLSKKSSSLMTENSLENRKSFWSQLFVRNEINDNFFETLEETFIKADLGAMVAIETVSSFRNILKQKNIKNIEEAIKELKNILKGLLIPHKLTFAEKKVPVLCLTGVNGVGKTTTLAKLSYHYRAQNYSVVIAAADTFRAAAIPQLEEWAKKTEAQLVNKGHLSDAAAVAYDAVEATLAKGGTKSICLIDTAGRLENKSHLMEQLGKLMRILGRFSEHTDLKKILVVDATLGRNGVDQAKVFTEKIGLDGIILTKVDTQAKAGFLLTISHELQLPIFFFTYGENIEALSPFDSNEYLEAMLNQFS